MTPRPGSQLTPTARLGIRALRTPRPWQAPETDPRLVPIGWFRCVVIALVAFGSGVVVLLAGRVLA